MSKAGVKGGAGGGVLVTFWWAGSFREVLSRL